MTALAATIIILVGVPLVFGTSRAVQIALDQLVNAYLLGCPDATISSRA